MNIRYFQYLKNQFPELPSEANELISDKLISPFTLRLPKKILTDAQRVVENLYSLREKPDYLENVHVTAPLVAQPDPGNKSICMSYDFHLDATETLKLIEVNTNAAFLLMGYYLYQCQDLPLPVPQFDLDAFHTSLLEEARLANNPLSSIAIIDETPQNQRLFIEFLLYEQLFKQYGYLTRIADPSALSFAENGLLCDQQKIDFVYNRTTDFYFEQTNLWPLKEAYLNRAVTLSPNPHEYALLADKHRLIEWSLNLKNSSAPHPELQAITKNLLGADYLTDANSDELWAKKRKLFFKPLTSFGSKGTYRGEGISRPYFDQLINKNCIAQEYCPPQERVFEANGFPSTKLKYDLRFYAYKDQVQMVIARLYQGQVTNLKTSLGGFAPVLFE